MLQGLIDPMGQGDHAARRELFDRACRRLRRLAARMRLHPRKVCYLWISATDRLADSLTGAEGLL